MSSPRVTLVDLHDDTCQRAFAAADGNEAAAVILFRKISREAAPLPLSDRYLSVDAFPFERDWIIRATPTEIRYQTAPLRPAFRRCEEEDLVFGFVHNHPGGLDRFSSVDDENETTLLQALVNRNGEDAEIVSLLWNGRSWKGRVLGGARVGIAESVRHVTVLGDFLKVHLAAETQHPSEQQARQAAAFGTPFSAQLSSLRVAIVGCGGTGSPSATLLARAGVGELILIDHDRLEESNLNRVRGAGKADVGRMKAKVLARYVNGLGLNCTAAYLVGSISDSASAVAALSTADLVLGCTDDYTGREVLNKALYVYGQPLIDLGLGGTVSLDGGDATLHDQHARMSFITPSFGACLFCQRVITADRIKRELRFRADPDRARQEEAEGYLVGGHEQAPGVGPFTGAVANFAVASIFDLVRPYRKLPPHLLRTQILLNFVTMEIESRAVSSSPDCPYCTQGRFTAMREEDGLLGRPALRQS